MRTNGVHGLNYHFFPGDLSEKKDASIVEVGVDKVINGENQIHVFTGEMPDMNTLYQFETVADLLAASAEGGYGDELMFSVGVEAEDKFDIKYSYDKERKERVIKKWPVNAKTYKSLKAGLIQWVAIKLEGQTSTDGKDQILFTNAVGGWDDPEVIIMLNKLNITMADEDIELKDFTYSANDVLAIDAVAGEAPAVITFDDTASVSSTSVDISISNGIAGALDGKQVTVTYTQSGASEGVIVNTVVASDSVTVDLSTINTDGLGAGDQLLVNVAGTYATKTIA